MTNTKTTTALHDAPVGVRAKLAGAWTSFMFLYIYVDHLGLYKPGFIDDILAGVVFEFDISQTFVVMALTSAAIPMFMILLSMTLPARVNRAINLVVATLLIPWMAFNLAGGQWMAFYGLGLALEVLLLGFILRSAWTWPQLASSRTATDRLAAPHALPTSAG
jgi:hypothetical protein